MKISHNARYSTGILILLMGVAALTMGCSGGILGDKPAAVNQLRGRSAEDIRRSTQRVKANVEAVKKEIVALKKTVNALAPVTPGKPVPRPKTRSLPHQKKAPGQFKYRYIVLFDNESARFYPGRAHGAIRMIKRHVDSGRVILVGHSHGVSRVGVGHLARRRANSVYHYLVTAGIPKEKIVRYSAWGGANRTEMPQRAVEIILTSAGTRPEQKKAPLALTIQDHTAKGGVF